MLQSVGFNPPPWDYLAQGETPPEEDVESEGDRNIPKGWEKASTRMVEHAHFSAETRRQLTEPEVALWRSQHGPLVPFVAFPTNCATRIDPQPFQVLFCCRLRLPLDRSCAVLLRRLRLPLPLSVRRCRCGRQLDSHGHHAACGEAGREGKGRVSTNVMVTNSSRPMGTPNTRTPCCVIWSFWSPSPHDGVLDSPLGSNGHHVPLGIHSLGTNHTFCVASVYIGIDLKTICVLRCWPG